MCHHNGVNLYKASSNECDCPAETDCVLGEQRKFINLTFAVLGIVLKSVVPCDKLFNSAGSMDDLKGWKYGLESDCTLCGKVFNSRMQLARHKKTMHSGQPRHTYQFCSNGFMKKCHMKKHMELCSKGKSRRKKSAKESKYKCTVCNLVFANSKSLDQHITRFHGIVKSTNKFARHFAWRQGILKCSMCSQIITLPPSLCLGTHITRIIRE